MEKLQRANTKVLSNSHCSRFQELQDETAQNTNFVDLETNKISDEKDEKCDLKSHSSYNFTRIRNHFDIQHGNYVNSHRHNKTSLRISIVKRKKAYKKLPKLTTSNDLKKREVSAEHLELIREKSLSSIINKVIKVSLNEKQREAIRTQLETEQIINEELDEATIQEILDSFSSYKIPPNTIIYSKGVEESLYYIIDSGEIEYLIDDETDTLHSGDCIGTKALENSSSQNCYLYTKEKSAHVFCLDIQQYKEIIENFKIGEKDKRIRLVKNIPIFKYLNPKTICQLVNKVKKVFYMNHIITDMKIPEKLFIVVEGNVKCTKQGKLVKVLYPNDYFCDGQLFCYMESYFDYLSEDVCILYEIEYKSIVEILGDKYIEKLINAMFKQIMKQSNCLSRYVKSEEVMTNLFNKFQLKYYYNDVVLDKNNRKLLIVISGRLVKQGDLKMGEIPSEESIVVQSGDLFGENYGENSKNYEPICSRYECIVFEGDWNEILKCLKGLSSNKNLSIYERINLLRVLPFFKHLSDFKLFQICDSFKLEIFEYNNLLIKNGPVSNKFYLIKSGAVKMIIDGKPAKEFKKDEAFGDIIGHASTYTRKACFVVASREAECYTITKQTYEEIVESFSPVNKNKMPRDITINVDNLFYLSLLGKGTYGKVYLAHNKRNFYAVKSAHASMFNKNKIIGNYYLNEKNIMLRLDHPFIVQLINTFKYKEYIFYLMEYIEGMTLEKLIANKNTLGSEMALRFYAGIILSTLNYINKMKIIHRDVKPENCIIALDGYLKIIDFGVAKVLDDKDFTKTLIGTPHFMAPELISGKPYSFQTDYWSAGVILYKMFYGKLPFGDSSKDIFEVYKETTEKKVYLPAGSNNQKVNALLKQLLKKSPIKRVISVKKFKLMELFLDFSFEKLLEKQIEPPFKPANTLSLRCNLKNSEYPFIKFIDNEQNSHNGSKFEANELFNEF